MSPRAPAKLCSIPNAMVKFMASRGCQAIVSSAGRELKISLPWSLLSLASVHYVQATSHTVRKKSCLLSSAGLCFHAVEIDFPQAG